MSESRPATTELLRFGVFEVDPSSRELRKQGVRLKLQDQPFAVLLILLEKPGELVTKEELRQRLWPAETFVEFDKGIYNAMKRLRESLSDGAEAPRFIETVPRRGYRFIAPIEVRDGAGKRTERPTAPETSPRSPGFKRWAVLASVLCLLFLAAIFVSVKLLHSPAVPNVIDSAQITKDGSPKSRATIKLVSDGQRLYFQEGALNETEQNTALTQVSTQGGETARIPIPLRNPVVYDFSQAHSELLLGAGEFALPSDERPLWALPLPVGPPHRVGDIVTSEAVWGPDGHHFAFTHGKDVFLATADGTDIHKLTTVDAFDAAFWIRFSPDGKRLRFTAVKYASPKNEEELSEVMEMEADGTGLHSLPIQGGCCGAWSGDGRNYFYQKGRDIWDLPEHRSLLGKIQFDNNVQLTAGPIGYGPPTPSADGKKLFVIGQQARVELMHYAAHSKQWMPFLGGISAGELEVSPDGQWVVYTTFPEFNLWRSKLDGSERLQLTFSPINAHEPRWSPDGREILFTDFPKRILVVPSSGGAPRELMPTDHPESIGAGAWLPDGKSIVFGRYMGCPASNNSCWGIFRIDLQTQQVSKIPGSDGMVAARLSHDGRYVTSLFRNENRVMLYDFRTSRWSELAQAFGSIAWSHDSKSIYVHLKHATQPAEIVRISVPDGQVQRVLELKDLTLGGLWPDWISLLPDDSPVIMLERSTEEIYRLDLQYR